MRNPMPQRTFRCPDREWLRAHGAAYERGDNLSEVLREFVRAYGESLIHQTKPESGSFMTCCGKAAKFRGPFDLLTRDPDKVTCPGVRELDDGDDSNALGRSLYV